MDRDKDTDSEKDREGDSVRGRDKVNEAMLLKYVC
jgi:hypothetical protein